MEKLSKLILANQRVKFLIAKYSCCLFLLCIMFIMFLLGKTLSGVPRLPESSEMQKIEGDIHLEIL